MGGKWKRGGVQLGPERWGVMVRLDRAGAANVLDFSPEADLTPVVDTINVE